MRAILLSLALLCLGCVVTPDGEKQVHWPTVASELDLAADDIEDVAAVLEADNPDLALTLRRVSVIAENAALAITEGGVSSGPEAVDRALAELDDIWEALTGEDLSPEALAAVTIARSILRRTAART